MMNSAIAKITLLTCLSVGAVGTAAAAAIVPCPTVAGKLTFAWQPKGPAGEDWYAERVAPSGAAQYTKWARLAVIIKDRSITNADEALKRGQAMLDSSWWQNAEAIVRTGSNNTIYYQCEYLMQDELSQDGSWIALISYAEVPESDLPAARVQSNSINSSREVLQPSRGVLTKSH